MEETAGERARKRGSWLAPGRWRDEAGGSWSCQCSWLGWPTSGEEVRILLKKSSWYYLSFFDYVEDGLHGAIAAKTRSLGNTGVFRGLGERVQWGWGERDR